MNSLLSAILEFFRRFTSSNQQGEQPTPKPVHTDTLIFVLAGHGGRDPGAVANNVNERDLALEQQQLITKQLKEKGYKQVLNEASDISLIDTINYVKSELAQREYTQSILVDLHFNAATPAAAGTEVFHKTQATAKEKQLAAELSKSIAEALDTHDRGAKPESWSQHSRLGVLHTGVDVSVLIETAFITNTPELNTYLSSKQAVTSQITQTLDTFLE